MSLFLFNCQLYCTRNGCYIYVHNVTCLLTFLGYELNYWSGVFGTAIGWLTVYTVEITVLISMYSSVHVMLILTGLYH